LNPEYWEYMHKHMHLLTYLDLGWNGLEWGGIWGGFDGNFVHFHGKNNVW